MKLKYQWFLGGKTMFWVSIILFSIMVIGFIITYIIDPITLINMKTQSVDPTSIKNLSEKYVACFDVEIDKPIVYRFVHYYDHDDAEDSEDLVTLGTFHEWNGTYIISISVDLYRSASLNEIVIHETRHMLVAYLKEKKIVNLMKYTEEIAEGRNERFDELFNCGMFLLKEKQKENENG